LQHRFEAGAALKLIEDERCTMFYGMANMAQAMTEHPRRANFDLSSLRTGATIGAPAQIQRIVDLGVREICNVYGLTEAYGNSAVSDARAPLEQRLHSCGRPLNGVSIRIVDPDSGMVLPAGNIGEIAVAGRVTPGYLNDPARTAASLDGDGYLRTGDLGFLDAEGNLVYRGRLKEMVKTGGINVAPAEVEAVLMRHGAVEQVYVTGLADPKLDQAVAAVIVARPGHSLDPADLSAHCRRSLAGYKIPRHYRFVTAGDLPLTATGKLMKNRLGELFDPIGGPADGQV
jgi:fatty-acyl-CoA synthase